VLQSDAACCSVLHYIAPHSQPPRCAGRAAAAATSPARCTAQALRSAEAALQPSVAASSQAVPPDDISGKLSSVVSDIVNGVES